MIKAIVFDFDGTLFRFSHLGLKLLKEVLDEEGIKFDEKKFDSLPHINMKDKLEIVFPKEHEKLFEKWDAKFSEEFIKQAKPYDDVIETLKTLHEQNFKLIIFSTKFSRHINNALNKYKIKNIFHSIIGREMTPAKPNPKLLNEELKKLGISNKEVLFVGDSKLDETSAKNTKLRFVLVDYGENQELINNPYAKINNLTELFKLIEE